MLGSLSEADDAVQEAWLRLSRDDRSDVETLGAWLTTVVARVSLNMLRARNARREEPFGMSLPEPIVDRVDGIDPEHEAVLADSVGLALLVVLETLSPPRAASFVLHDMFGVPFDEIGAIDGPLAEAAQLASRAAAVRAERAVPDAIPSPSARSWMRSWTAAREGDFDRLVAVLDPDVVLRSDFGGAAGARVVRGPRRSRASRCVLAARARHPAGARERRRVPSLRDGRPFAVGAVTVRVAGSSSSTSQGPRKARAARPGRSSTADGRPSTSGGRASARISAWPPSLMPLHRLRTQSTPSFRSASLAGSRRSRCFAFMAINIALRVWLPNDSPVRVAWLVPAIEGVLLAILLLGRRRSRRAGGASSRR